MKNKIFGIISIIIGLVTCYFSIGNFKENSEKQKTYIEATAIVIGYEECELDNNSIGQRYIAEYKIDRDTYQIKSNSCTNMPKGVNKKVTIKYNPDNPSDAVFANDISYYLVLPLGIIFTICGLVLIFKKSY